MKKPSLVLIIEFVCNGKSGSLMTNVTGFPYFSDFKSAIDYKSFTLSRVNITEEELEKMKQMGFISLFDDEDENKNMLKIVRSKTEPVDFEDIFKPMVDCNNCEEDDCQKRDEKGFEKFRNKLGDFFMGKNQEKPT